MPDVTHYLVPAVLTEAQDQAFEDAVNAAGNTADGFRAVGVPFSGSQMRTLAHVSRGGDRISLRRKQDRDIPLVRQSDAAALIATRDAKIAELTAKLDTIAQETREACAQLCDDSRLIEISAPADWHNDACKMCAAAIRNAGEKS